MKNQQHPSFTSLQRWIYVDGYSIEGVLHNLADAVVDIDLKHDIPTSEYININQGNGMTVEIVYCEDDDKPYKAGICISYKYDRKESDNTDHPND